MATRKPVRNEKQASRRKGQGDNPQGGARPVRSRKGITAPTPEKATLLETAKANRDDLFAKLHDRFAFPHLKAEAVGSRIETCQEVTISLSSLEVPSLECRALEVFGNQQVADQWMATPNRALGDVAPRDLVQSDGQHGQQRVEQVLGRIEHGIFE